MRTPVEQTAAPDEKRQPFFECLHILSKIKYASKFCEWENNLLETHSKCELSVLITPKHTPRYFQTGAHDANRPIFRILSYPFIDYFSGIFIRCFSYRPTSNRIRFNSIFDERASVGWSFVCLFWHVREHRYVLLHAIPISIVISVFEQCRRQKRELFLKFKESEGTLDDKGSL